MVGFLTDTKVLDANNTTFAGNSTDINVAKPTDARKFMQAWQGATARAIADQGGTATLSGTNTYTATLAQAYTAYGTSAGQIINGTVLAIKPTAANTTAATVNFNTIGAKAIRLQGDSALVGGEMLANGIYLLRYDTAYNSAAGAWVLLNPASALGVTAPTASTTAARDSSANLFANNFIGNYATTATAAGTTTLTVASAATQYFTGTSTQTVLLPVASTLTLGLSFRIINNSTGLVTVQSSGTNTIKVMGGTLITLAPGAPGTELIVTCILTSGTGTASWSYEYKPPTTDWVAYTPTFTGFGTPTGVFAQSRRVGDTLEFIAKFNPGTTTGVEARMTMGYNGGNNNVTSDATKVPSIQVAGINVYSNTGAQVYTLLIESNVNYFTFGIQNAGNSGFTKQNASGIFGSGITWYYYGTVPILNAGG